MLTVIKFGGSSLANAAKIQSAAKKAAEFFDRGIKTVVVVSAQGKTTDELIKNAREISEDPPERELDVLLSTGEQCSMSLMASALVKMGYPAVSLAGWQAGIETAGTHGKARIKNINAARIVRELDEGKIVVVAGFQGINPGGDITTIGRGGSDTTAVALAAALSADECVIFTDVKGVYSADPRVVKDAKKYESIGFDEMLEMSSLGAGVLHNRAVELAKLNNVKLRVCSSSSSEDGTLICEKSAVGHSVQGIVCDKNTALIEVLGGKTSVLPGVLEILSELNVTSDMITDIENRLGFTVSRDSAEKVVKIVSENAEKLKIVSVSADKNVSKVSLVGTALSDDPRNAARMLGTLLSNGISVKSVVAGEIKISALVDTALSDKAVKVLHGEFFGQMENQ